MKRLIVFSRLRNLLHKADKALGKYIGKQSLRAVLRTLIKMYTFAPNFKFGTK